MIHIRCEWCGKRHAWDEMRLVYDGLNPRLEPYGCEMRNNEHGGSLCIPVGVVFAARVVKRAVPDKVFIEIGGA